MPSQYNPTLHHRRSIRLPTYDYAQAGAYFVTVCAHQKARVFGEIANDVMRLNAWGEVVREEWLRTAEVRRDVELDAFVVMPNHFHGIIILSGAVGATRRVAPTRSHATGPKSKSLGAILAQFKSMVTKRITTSRQTSGIPVWQRNYYEHIIRSERELHQIRQYIADNPRKWALDHENPARAKT